MVVFCQRWVCRPILVVLDETIYLYPGSRSRILMLLVEALRAVCPSTQLSRACVSLPRGGRRRRAKISSSVTWPCVFFSARDRRRQTYLVRGLHVVWIVLVSVRLVRFAFAAWGGFGVTAFDRDATQVFLFWYIGEASVKAKTCCFERQTCLVWKA